MVEYPTSLDVVVKGRIGAEDQLDAESNFEKVVQRIFDEHDYRIESIDVTCKPEIPGIYKCKADIRLEQW